jgi:hypothetical protein
MIYFAAATDEIRSTLLRTYLESEWGFPLRGRMRQFTYPELFQRRSLPRGAWIFTALDALARAELELVHCLQNAAEAAGLPVFNRARETMGRYELLETLHREGRNDFRAYPAGGPLDGIRFPVFVREISRHNGSLTPLLENRAALRRAMVYLRLRGLPLRELLVVEFCDTSTAGLFRKYSVFRIGDRYVPRYLHIGPEWMTKSWSSSVDEALAAEELSYIRENPHREAVHEIFEIARIRYGRIDYGFLNGRLQTWEINTAPVFTADRSNRPATPEALRRRKLKRAGAEYSHGALRSAFEAIDPGDLPGADVEAEFPPGLIEEARRQRRELRSVERRQERISRLCTFRGFQRVGPLLRRTFGG